MTDTRYQRLDGTLTTEDDPKRGVWYGPCGCWTDNWSLLGKTPEGIPICPNHGCVGFQGDAGRYIEFGVAAYGDDGTKFYSYKLDGPTPPEADQ